MIVPHWQGFKIHWFIFHSKIKPQKFWTNNALHDYTEVGHTEINGTQVRVHRIVAYVVKCSSGTMTEKQCGKFNILSGEVRSQCIVFTGEVEDWK